jgi:membrane dipeptidase
VSNIKYITEGLVARGYSDQEIMKVLGGSWLNYFKMIWGE